jgi:S-layer homology domain
MRATHRFPAALGLLLLGSVFALVWVGLGASRPTRAAAIGGAASPLETPTCGPMWLADTTPNVGTTDNALAGVAVISPTDVWAVGFYTDTNGIGNALIEHYTGSGWAIVSGPRPGTGGSYLEAVTAVAANDVWAVGFYRQTAGSAPQTMALHYNGTSWTQATSDSPGAAENYLYGIAMVSATDGWAVGYTADTANIYKTLTLRLNGTQWRQVPSPTPFLRVAGLRGVVVVSANEVWAVGVQVDISLTLRMYAIKWNGSVWSAVTTPTTSGCVLTAVSIASGSNLWAVGGCQTITYQTVVLRWNGSAWATVASPSPGTGDNLLGGVVSAGANDAYAVGGYNDTSGNVQTLALHWDGIAWTQISSDNPGSSGNALFAVARDPASSSTLWAVGTQSNGGASETLAEHIIIIPCEATNTPTVASTGTPTPTTAATATTTPTVPSTATGQPSSTATGTSIPATGTTTGTTTATPGEPSATPTACGLQFEDVPAGNTFYPFVRCLACRGIINGYPCGGVGEPCDPGNNPYFRPNNNVTRGQIAKIVSNAAGFNEPVSGQTFEDVLPGSTFYDFVERLVSRQIMSGYACGGPGEPCGPENRPYFRPNSNASRGQLAKIVSNAAGFHEPVSGQTFEDVLPGSTFYDFVGRLVSRSVMSGYPCGGPGEPCGPENRPYFRPGNLVTRGQTSKIVGNTFFPECDTP